MSKTHFVLIHGAYHTSWHLQFLKKELESAGHIVSTLDLPSAGPNAVEDNAMTADTLAIKTLIEEVATTAEPSSIVPLFHSYAGIPGGDAVHELSPNAKTKILRLVYLAAFAVPQGSGLTASSGGKIAPWATAVPSNPKFRYVPSPVEPFYHDVEPSLAAEAAAHCVQNSYSAFTQTTKYCGWAEFPRTFVFCSEDRAALPERSRGMFEGMEEGVRKGWEFEYIGGSHSPFLSRPRECARLLRRIAGEEEM